jgi:hypothetical protein
MVWYWQRWEVLLQVNVEIDFGSKRGEVMVIGRKQVIRVRKKVEMPQIEFSRKAIKEIKNRKKRMKKEVG